MTATKDTLANLQALLAGLDNPHRLRAVALLSNGRLHVSELARQLGISRPVLYMHLEKLEAAGLVTRSLELSPEGKAMNYCELKPFDLRLTPATISKLHEEA